MVTAPAPIAVKLSNAAVAPSPNAVELTPDASAAVPIAIDEIADRGRPAAYCGGERPYGHGRIGAGARRSAEEAHRGVAIGTAGGDAAIAAGGSASPTEVAPKPLASAPTPHSVPSMGTPTLHSGVPSAQDGTA